MYIFSALNKTELQKKTAKVKTRRIDQKEERNKKEAIEKSKELTETQEKQRHHVILRSLKS